MDTLFFPVLIGGIVLIGAIALAYKVMCTRYEEKINDVRNQR